MDKKIGIGILGLGTVGTGVIRVLRQNADLIRRRLGASLEVRRIVRRNVERGVPEGVDWRRLTADAGALLRDPEIDIVVEVMGGYEPARSYLLEAMEQKKQVVTANKALLAVHGEELFQAAARHQVDLFFEGSVGGGIPVIQVLKESLAANRIESLYGIINGTSNFILTQMTEAGREFHDVLREAQALGYAEADPTLDVEGIDTAHKLAVLASLTYGTPVDVKEIHTEGISAISPVDITFAGELGYRIKLLAIAKGSEEGVLEARVHPTLIPKRHLMATVDGVLNAIYIQGDAVGPCLLLGRGAWELPTASAVVGDILAAALNLLSGSSGKTPSAGYSAGARRPLALKKIEEIASHYYFRFMALDQPGVLSRISGILGEHQISIASVMQKGRKEGGTVPLVMMTHGAVERNVRQALQEIDGLPIVSEKTVMFRVEGGEEP
ncbi:MAG: homoserine dehydrogenase [Nitrospirae bacterium]|nr:homoserine dehydrogenase [Nitrospirota bacterium]